MTSLKDYSMQTFLNMQISLKGQEESVSQLKREWSIILEILQLSMRYN